MTLPVKSALQILYLLDHKKCEPGTRITQITRLFVFDPTSFPGRKLHHWCASKWVATILAAHLPLSLYHDCSSISRFKGFAWFGLHYFHITSKLLTDTIWQPTHPWPNRCNYGFVPREPGARTKMYSKVVSSFRTMHMWKAKRVATNSSKGRFKILRVECLWERWRWSVSALWSSYHLIFGDIGCAFHIVSPPLCHRHISMYNDEKLWRYDHPLFHWHQAQRQHQFASREQHEWHDSDHTVLEPGEGNTYSQATKLHGPIRTPWSLPLPLEMQRPHIESPANAAKGEFSWV